MRILITGATGFVGRRLVSSLLKSGHQVRVLTRSLVKAASTLGADVEYIQWDTQSKLEQRAFENIDSVVNLAGENLSDKRWSEEQKRRIYDSRVRITEHLVAGIKEFGTDVKSFISTSAVGIYGSGHNNILDENAKLGDDFLARVCLAWERSALKYEDQFPRICILRLGVVLGEEGGALEKMLPIFKLGLGGPVGSGKQVMSWIHCDDLVRLFVSAIENDSMKGVFNATAPYPVENKVFSKVLGKCLNRPAVFKAPSIALELALGEMSTIVLDGQNVQPKKAIDMGFEFKYPKVDQALSEIVSHL